jgi:nucleotide-binding universal stress UspA family protein
VTGPFAAEENEMLKVLVPVDGSDNALRALRHVIATRSRYSDSLDLHVLNVQRPIASGAVRMFISQDTLNDYYREEGEKALESARELTAQSGMACRFHIAVGEEGASIAHYADEHSCDLIVMGTRGMGGLGNLVLGSVATRVIHLAHVPVTLVK